MYGTKSPNPLKIYDLMIRQSNNYLSHAMPIYLRDLEFITIQSEEYKA
jgi:hypothetical protein